MAVLNVVVGVIFFVAVLKDRVFFQWFVLVSCCLNDVVAEGSWVDLDIVYRAKA